MLTQSRTKIAGLILALAVTQGFACQNVKDLSKQQQAELFFNETLTSISIANQQVGFTVMAVNRQKMLDDVMANKILNYNIQVAQTATRVRSIIQSGKPWTDRSQEALALLRTLKLPEEIRAFINRPGTDAAFSAMVTAVILMDGLLRTATVIAEGGQ